MAPRTHTHDYTTKTGEVVKGRVICKYGTKKECDENWREYKKKKKLEYEEAERQKNEEARTARVAKFDAFISKENQRLERGLPWTGPLGQSGKNYLSDQTGQSETATAPSGPMHPTPPKTAGRIRLAPVPKMSPR